MICTRKSIRFNWTRQHGAMHTYAHTNTNSRLGVCGQRLCCFFPYLNLFWSHSLFWTAQSQHDIRTHALCVGVYIKPFLLPVDIQHNQCPCGFFNPRRDTSYVVSKLRHRDTTLPCTRCQVWGTWYAISTAVGNAIPCHNTRYDRHDIHILWNRGTKGNHQWGNKNKEDESKEKKNKWKKKTKNDQCGTLPPGRDVANTTQNIR